MKPVFTAKILGSFCASLTLQSSAQAVPLTNGLEPVGATLLATTNVAFTILDLVHPGHPLAFSGGIG